MDNEFWKELKERLDEIYVSRDTYGEDVKEVNKRLAANDERYAVINTKLSAILWLLGVLGTAVITFIVKLILG